MDSSVPRGIANANPGNIRHSRDAWQGEAALQSDPSFVQFKAPEWGIRAIVKILRNYKAAGITTIASAVSRWAPPAENNTKSYTDDVCASCNIGPYTPVDLDTIMPDLVKAIIRHENGVMPYPDALIQRGIDLA